HMYGFLSHGITADAMVTEFESFLDDFWWPYVENRLDHALVEATTRWACVEMIESGVTSFVDILEGPNSIPGALEVERRVVEEAGLRGFLSFEACERMSPENGQLGLAENISFVDRHNREGELVQGMNSIHTLFTCSKDFVKQAKRLSDEHHCMTHMHLSESVFEPDWCRERYGKTPVEIYDALGYLDEHILASQVVQVTDAELDILAKRGVKAVSMPVSNCEVGGGFAPLTKMLERGMTVGLGTDGYVNNFFEVMRGAFLMHKANQQDPQVMPARTVYEMATSMGARAVGLADAGELKEGSLADVITVSLDQPTPVNEYNVYDQLVLFTNPQQVRNVYVNGRCLKEDGRLTTIDREAARESLRNSTAEFWNVGGKK
ncbi:MAG: amidohydrolase family protein, partial [Lachnospiraceae bacterium]|nr:amidohydrolase family protein [Lachnospiraceae bacterium]